MIYILWPTVRPKVMIKRYQQWLEAAKDPDKIKIRIGVNTSDDAKILKDAGYKYILVCGNKFRGVAPTSYALSSQLQVQSKDIVILASDDFCVPNDWDKWLIEQFKNFDGCLLVDDGIQYGGCVTIPIMTYACLKRLNHIIYHPSYSHLYADAELFDNLLKLKLFKDLRKNGKSPLFEHKHYQNGKRPVDKNDKFIVKTCLHSNKSSKCFNKRMKKNVKLRLIVGDRWKEYAKAAYLI